MATKTYLAGDLGGTKTLLCIYEEIGGLSMVHDRNHGVVS